MPGLRLGLGRQRGNARWWPAGATWAADFIGDRYMRDGVAVSASDAFTFTRASSKFAPRGDGLLVPFAPDVPARTDLGLLLEPAATNLCTYFPDLTDSSWIKNGCIATPGQPDPTSHSGATLIEEQDSGALLRRQSSIAVTIGATYTVSCYVKR